MPVLTVKGMPSDVNQAYLDTLLGRLQTAAGGTLKIFPGAISVFFPVDIVKRGIGEELICVVDGLSEGTSEVRQRLASSILGPLEDFAAKNLPQCCDVEVIVNRWNQEVDGFADCDPR